MRIATFNLWHGSRLDRALEVARAEPMLAQADVLALQEADRRDAERIAVALGMDQVAYYGTRHPRTGRGFGPALLSRWPVVECRCLDLPHPGVHRLRRFAVVATLLVGEVSIRAYAVHFGTVREILPLQQNAQARAVLLDAAGYGGPAVLAGDFNRKGIGRMFQAEGWSWITRDVGPTHWIWSFDHVLTRGWPSGETRAGSVRAALRASDHRAVWAEASVAALTLSRSLCPPGSSATSPA